MTAPVRFSVVVPAHNEEELLPRGLEAIQGALARAGGSGEIIVVANRCTDATESLAAAGGAKVVLNDARSIAAVRNAGVAASRGTVVVTIDADTLMHPMALRAVDARLASGRFVGGGCDFVPERSSPGIRMSLGITRIAVAAVGLGGVMYWCRRTDFDSIGGFDERRPLAEDMDFARRLRRHGSITKRRFANLHNTPAVVSCRKFDAFGDWHMFTLAAQLPSVRASMKGRDTGFVDRYFYDFNN